MWGGGEILTNITVAILHALYINSFSRILSESVKRRALYGYPCPEDSTHNSRGIYRNSDGILYVK